MTEASAQDLTSARTQIRALHARRAIAEAALNEVSEGAVVHLMKVGCPRSRCDQQSLARVYRTTRGLLFASRIVELVRDDVEWPPWWRDWRYLGIQGDELDLDERLSGHLRSLDAGPFVPPGESRQRWRKLGYYFLLDVVSLPAAAGTALPRLWVRCPQHPAPPRQVRRDALLNHVRRSEYYYRWGSIRPAQRSGTLSSRN